MTQPGFITQQDLLQWADRLGARSELPRLIRRLVLETGRDVQSIDFPAAEGTAAGSWDGISVAATDSPFVPGGQALWELSVESSANKKAESDYVKRTSTPDGSPTSDSTYVAVSLRRWRDRRKFATAKTNERRWKRVKAYGVDDIEAWLESAPVTHAWVSEQLGLKPYGMQTADTWWEAWSSATNPALTTEIVLAGRQSVADAMRQAFDGRAGITTLRGDSLDEVLATVAAVALEGDAAGHGQLLARVAFVDDVGTWRALAGHDRPLVLVARTPDVAAEARAAPNHHVVVPLTGARDADIELPPIDTTEATAALKEAGLDDDRRADDAARLGRRSLLTLRRHLATKPELHTPAWATPLVDRVVRGALVASTWHDDAEGDQQVLTDLTGLAYDDLRERLTELAAQEDPLVTRVGQSWTVVSPFDAWRQLRAHVRPDDMGRFRGAVESVLLEDDPKFGLAPEERWRASYEGKYRRHSSDLRGGLVTTVALLGTLGERVDAGPGATGVSVANGAVRRLLAKANEDASGARWAALSDHLRLIAEGAPDAFLDGVRAGTVGDDPVLSRMFQDEDADPLFSSSAHTGLLWGLEVAAWSPEHFAQSVYLLARLSEIDQGGRLSNRPSNSLTSIFCPWHPETTASNQRRLEVLDELRKRHSDVAWGLMVALLPEWHGIHHPTVAPRFQEWKPSRVVVTNVQWFEFTAELVDRLIIDAADLPVRWQKLLKESNHVSPSDRAKIRDALAGRVKEGALREDDREALWNELRETVARHREHADADWALPGDEIDALESIERELMPAGTVASLAWLFEDHMPDLGTGSKRKNGEYDHAGYTAALDSRRQEAVAEITESEGWDGVLALARRATVPWAVGVALAECDSGSAEENCLALLANDPGAEERLASGYLSRRFAHDGWPWLDRLITEGSLAATQIARLLLLTFDQPTAWQRADELGDEVAQEYWTGFSPFGLGGNYAHVAETAHRLHLVGRPAAALHLLVLYATRSDEADPKLAVLAADALDDLLRSKQQANLETLSHYDLTSVFEFLEKHRNLVSPDRVARLEWAYLPALGYDPSIPSLHQQLADDPAFFVEILSAIYRRRSDEAPTTSPTPQQEQVATNAYRLLSSWEHPPGLKPDGTIDPHVLRRWIDTVLPLLDEADRRGVGEIHIGHVLAFAPADSDGARPGLAVRDLLEALQLEGIEDGLQTQIYNNRGVTSRSPESGGDQERELARNLRETAHRFNDRWPRTASVLRSLASSYESDARRYDDDAERRRKGLEP